MDWYLYKERHLVECFFQKIKWFRRIATRYDKLDASFLAFVYLAAIALLLIYHYCFVFFKQGLVTYNGMTFKKFLLAFIRSELPYPKKLVFRSKNLYAKILKNSMMGLEKDD